MRYDGNEVQQLKNPSRKSSARENEDSYSWLSSVDDRYLPVYNMKDVCNRTVMMVAHEWTLLRVAI